MKGLVKSRNHIGPIVASVVAGWMLPIAGAVAAGYLAPAPTTSAAAPASEPQVKPVAGASAAGANKSRVNSAQWNELTADQRTALAPLSRVWNSLPRNRQLKWLTVANDFKKLSSADQEKLQSRMKDWVALDPKQRDQARIGFATTQALSPEDKKVKWEAYQALSPQDKAALAAQGEKKVGAAAKPIAPTPAEKKVKMPTAALPVASQAGSANSASAAIQSKPKLANVTESVSPQTLLPNPQH